MVATLRDLAPDDEAPDPRQAYYAGGQGRQGGGSGQQVLDPTDLMRLARDNHNAQTHQEYQEEQAAQQQRDMLFQGQGVSLNGQHTVQNPTAQEQKNTEHTITFYQDGFTLDDGPLRNTQDPENAAFLRDVQMGRLPQELISADGDAVSDVHLIDKTREKYKPPPATVKPFGGAGRSMREPGAAGASENAALESAEITVDDNAPTTTLQVRLDDGSRVMVKVNHSHTIGQLYSHVAAIRPSAAFDLATTFPRSTLTDMESTIASAELINATVVQTLRA